MITTDKRSFLTINDAPSPQTLPALPYAENALEPVISANTMSFHYRRHHKGVCGQSE